LLHRPGDCDQGFESMTIQLSIIATGFLFGRRQATDPDHIFK
jgi:hypothetical protein